LWLLLAVTIRSYKWLQLLPSQCGTWLTSLSVWRHCQSNIICSLTSLSVWRHLQYDDTVSMTSFAVWHHCQYNVTFTLTSLSIWSHCQYGITTDDQATILFIDWNLFLAYLFKSIFKEQFHIIFLQAKKLTFHLVTDKNGN
jgi:pterin-4a-carbinolamine dehydratase